MFGNKLLITQKPHGYLNSLTIYLSHKKIKNTLKKITKKKNGK